MEVINYNNSIKHQIFQENKKRWGYKSNKAPGPAVKLVDLKISI